MTMVLPANPDSAATVTREALEARLAAVQRNISQPLAGIFGPDSISWRVNRESALFLGAGRAALLQLAHPWVAAALDQHSSLLQNPIARFHNTFRVVFTMSFGSTPQAMTAARSLHHLHTRISGNLTESVAGYANGSSYEANHIPALRWVFATLVESAVIAYESVLLPLTDAERKAYYAESKMLAALFGIPSDALPPDWHSFKTYIAEMCQSRALGVSERSVYMAHRLLAGSGSWVIPPRWYRALTAEWMPPRFRVEFGLIYGPVDELSAMRAYRWLPKLYKKLPPAIRFVGPYHEAQARLALRETGFLARRSNQFWIGEPRLPFNE
jgi:uncharacterized protein (DUF2236 family)